MLSFILYEDDDEKDGEYSEEQFLRKLINGEYEAIEDYQKALENIKDVDTKKVITDIMNEEKVHVQELILLLKKVDKYYNSAVEKAKEEAASHLNEETTVQLKRKRD